MSLAELNDLNFAAEGNVASMSSLQTAGNLRQHMIPFPSSGWLSTIQSLATDFLWRLCFTKNVLLHFLHQNVKDADLQKP